MTPNPDPRVYRASAIKNTTAVDANPIKRQPRIRQQSDADMIISAVALAEKCIRLLNTDVLVGSMAKKRIMQITA